jgi:hypothetical protein
MVAEPVQSTGIIQKQTATTYQYGTHVLVNDNGQTLFALESKKVNLDSYINQTVDIKGNKIQGYPITGGPEYIEVTKVK